MNERQRRFVDEYLIDCNATQAAIRAGYSKKTAYSHGQHLLKLNEIKAQIDEQLERLQSERVASAREVLEFLTSVMRGQQTEQTLMFVGEGVQRMTRIEVSAKDRIKAAELLGKRYGIWKENIDVGGAIPIVISGSDALED